MKFIHCADLHLDSKIDTLPSDKKSIRREEILRTFEKLCDFATEHGVRAVIIAGDMFDTGKVTQRTRNRVINAIAKNNGVDFLYLSGNHDDDNFIKSLESAPENLFVFGDVWQSFTYGNVAISGIKFTETNSKTVYDSLELEKNNVNVVVMHGQTVGYAGKDTAEIIALPRLKEKNIDYLALGHIHSYVTGKLDERGEYAYSGCLDGRGFDETGDKGFVLLSTDNGKLEKKFIKFCSRTLHEVEFDVERFENRYDIRSALLESLQGVDGTSLVKIVLKGGHKLDVETDKEGLTSLLNEKFFFAKVYDKTHLKVEISDYEFDKSVCGEFVRSVLDSELDDQSKKKILMCGLNALKGEEI